MGIYNLKRALELAGLPYTRENYIRLNWPDGVEEWTWEHEEELPPDLRISEPNPAVDSPRRD